MTYFDELYVVPILITFCSLVYGKSGINCLSLHPGRIQSGGVQSIESCLKPFFLSDKNKYKEKSIEKVCL